MARKPKNRRLFSREDRRAARAEREAAWAALSAEEREAHEDEGVLRVYSPDLLSSPVLMADMWAAIIGNPAPDPDEVVLRFALERQFRRVTGETLTEDVADALANPQDYQ